MNALASMGMLLRRGRAPLTTKHGNKNYYKGVQATAPGHHTKKGGYRIVKSKLPRWVIPDLNKTELRPYVVKDVKPNLDKVPPLDSPASVAAAVEKILAAGPK